MTRTTPLRAFYAALASLAVAGALVGWWTTRWGAGLSDDSFQYISSAQNLAAGRGLQYPLGDGRLTPLTHFPPLYPLALAGFEAVGVGALEGARWLGALAFSLILWLVGLTLHRATGSTGYALLGTALALASPVLIELHTWAMTEALFLLMGLAGIYLLIRYLGRAGRASLAGAAVFSGLATLTRFIGVVLPLVMAGVIAGFGPGEVRRRVREATVFLAVSLVPIGLWLVRTLALTGAPTDRTLGWHPPTPNLLRRGLNTVLIWFLPGRVVHGYETRWALLVLVLAALLWGLWARRRRESSALSPAWRGLNASLAAFMLVYPLTLLGSRTLFDRAIPLDDRLLAPIYLAGIVLGVSLVAGLERLNRPAGRYLVVTLALALLAFNGYRSYERATWLHDQGIGYASRGWHRSPTLEMVRELPPVPLFSNAAAAIYLWTGRTAHPVGDLEGMRASMTGQEAVLVVFDSIPLALYGVSQPDLTRGLVLEHEFRDGLIYRAP